MPYLEHQGTTRELTKGGQVIVGSGSQAEWKLQGVDLAARHFTVSLEDGGRAVVKPQSSQHLLVVNGRQVPAEGQALNHGDAIGAGSATIVYLEDLTRARPQVASAASGQLYLVNEKERRAYPLIRKKVGIGRDAASHVLLRDPSVSRFHADIRAEAGQHVLYSMGSAGTKVNGTTLTNPQMLQDGDKIEVGDTHLLFTRTLPNGMTVADMAEDVEEDKLTQRKTMMQGTIQTGESDVIPESVSSKSPIIIAVVVVLALAAAYFLFMR